MRAVVSPPFDCMSMTGVRTPALEAALERPEIAADDRLEVGVDHRGRGALVLLHLGQDVEADRGGQVGRQSPDDLLEQPLVRRVGVGVEQADGDRLDALVEQAAHRALGVSGLQRLADVSSGVDPLVHRDPQMARHQDRRLLPGHVVEPRHPKRADLEHVAEALGRDQAGARALALEDRVRGHGGAVADLLHLGRRGADLLEHGREPEHDGARIVVDGRGDLLGVEPAVGPQHHDVGEGAADVHADPGPSHRTGSAWTSRPPPRLTRGSGPGPRRARSSARRARVAGASTVQRAVSTTTP